MVMPGLLWRWHSSRLRSNKLLPAPAEWRTKQYWAEDLLEHDLHEARLNHNWLVTHRHLSNE
jgi:hypothetical protein